MIGLFRSPSTRQPPPPRERPENAPDAARVLAAFLANLERLCAQRRRPMSGEGAR